MSKISFIQECQHLESLGYGLVDYQPENKYAKYILNGSVKIVGELK